MGQNYILFLLFDLRGKEIVTLTSLFIKYSRTFLLFFNLGRKHFKAKFFITGNYFKKNINQNSHSPFYFNCSIYLKLNHNFV